MARSKKQKAILHSKKSKIGQPQKKCERVIAYRLRDRDLAQLLIFEHSSRLILNGVLEIINRMRQGEHPSTEEELADDESGCWTIDRFLREWGICQKTFFENKE